MRPHAAAARAHLPTQVSLDAADYTEATALHCAAALGDGQSCTQLLKAGASPRARDAEGLCPLHLAVSRMQRRSLHCSV